MTDFRISDLAGITTLDEADLFECVHSGSSNKVTLANLRTALLVGAVAFTTISCTALTANNADGANTATFAGTTGKLVARGYVDATIGSSLAGMNAAESAYTAVTFIGNPIRFAANGMLALSVLPSTPGTAPAGQVLIGGGEVHAAGDISCSVLVAIDGVGSGPSVIAQGGGPNQGWYGFGTSNYGIQGGPDYLGMRFNVSGATQLNLSADGSSSFSGKINVNSAAASTSSTTGALVVGGGLGVAGAGFFGGGITCTSLTASGNASANLGIFGEYTPTVNARQVQVGWNGTNYTVQAVQQDVGYQTLKLNPSGGAVECGAGLSATSITTSAIAGITLNNASGTYAGFKYDGTAVGDIGTANQVLSGATNDIAICSRAATGGNLVLGASEVAQVTISNAAPGTPGATKVLIGAGVIKAGAGIYCASLTSAGKITTVSTVPASFADLAAVQTWLAVQFT